jgi:hypothetical protein
VGGSIKMHFREPSCEGTTQAQESRQVKGSCDHSNELLGSIACGDFADKLSSYRLVKHSAQWSLLVWVKDGVNGNFFKLT